MRVEPPTNACVLDGLLERRTTTIEKVLGHPFELAARQGLFEVKGALVTCGDEGKVDGSALGGAQLHLGLFAGLLQALHRHLVLGQVDAV